MAAGKTTASRADHSAHTMFWAYARSSLESLRPRTPIFLAPYFQQPFLNYEHKPSDPHQGVEQGHCTGDERLIKSLLDGVQGRANLAASRPLADMPLCTARQVYSKPVHPKSHNLSLPFGPDLQRVLKF